MSELIWTALLIAAVPCSAMSAVVAHSKNRPWPAWAGIGALFGIFGLLAAMGVPALEAKPKEAVAPKEPNSAHAWIACGLALLLIALMAAGA